MQLCILCINVGMNVGKYASASCLGSTNETTQDQETLWNADLQQVLRP